MSFFKKLSDTVSKGVSNAAEKAQQTVEITKLNSQISSKRKEISKHEQDIGEHVYALYSAREPIAGDEQITTFCTRIDALHEEIKDLHNRVMALRNEKDCVCGKRVPHDTRFCPNCGHAFPEPEPIEAIVVQDEDGGEQSSDGDAVAEPSDSRLKCKHCGMPLYADSHFCPSCGQTTQLKE